MAKGKYRLTEAVLERRSKEGRGKGRGRDYRPWLTISDVPSTGLTSRQLSATVGRKHTFFSKIELGTFLEVDWCRDVFDIREQFPIPRVETIAIAEAMGVPHPRDGSVDIVMTTDLLLDVAASPRAPAGLVAVTCKPALKLEDTRVLEKLEIERRYWAANDVPLRIVTEREVSQPRVLILTLLAERRSFEGCEEPRPGYWDDVCRKVRAALTSSSAGTLGELMASLEVANGWSLGDGLAGLLHLAAHRELLFDLDGGFDPRGPVGQVRVDQPSRASAVAA